MILNKKGNLEYYTFESLDNIDFSRDTVLPPEEGASAKDFFA